MGLNRQPRSQKRGTAPRHHRNHHNNAAGGGASGGTIKSGMSVKHRDMLLDVLRHAVADESNEHQQSDLKISEKDLAIGPRAGLAAQITFQRNKAKTLPEHLSTALEVIGFPSAAAAALAKDSTSSDSKGGGLLFALPQNVSSYLDLVRHEPFVVSAEWELWDLCVTAAKRMAGITGEDEEDNKEEEEEGLIDKAVDRHESRCSEWESFIGVYLDHFALPNKAAEEVGEELMMNPPYLFDPSKSENFAKDDEDDANDDDDDQQNDDDDEAYNDDDDPESTVALRFRTKGGDKVVLEMTISDDYPNRYPLFSVREIDFFGEHGENNSTAEAKEKNAKLKASTRIALGIPGSLRFSIFQALASIVISFPKGMPLLQSLTAAAQEVIEGASSWKESPEDEEKKQQNKTNNQQQKNDQDGNKSASGVSRSEFLDKLIEVTNALSKTSNNKKSGNNKHADPMSSSSDAANKNSTKASSSSANDDNTSAAIHESLAKLTSVAPCLAPPVKLRQLEAERSAESFSRSTFLINDNNENKNLLCKWLEVQKRGPLSEYRKTLPAYGGRDKLKQLLKDNSCVVVTADTGSGKSTQIPSYILEHYIEDNKGSQCNVVCTQPRRIAASSVALRVAEERDEQIGQLVGYSIRLENKLSKKTRLLYCTTGILLRRLQSDPYIGNISHVVVDEVHERSVDCDFLLILLKDLLKKRKNDLKVVLMSATADANKFSQYFGGAPILQIPGRTHPVRVVSLEAALVATGYRLEESSPFAIRDSSKKQRNNRKQGWTDAEIAEGLAESKEALSEDKALQQTVKEIKDSVEESTTAPTVLASPKSSSNDNDKSNEKDAAFQSRMLNLPLNTKRISHQDYEGAARTLQLMDPEKINYELIEEIILYIDQHFSSEGDSAILVFLPGLAEITQCMEQLQSNRQIASRSLILNLHSTLGSGAQQAVFNRPPKGKRKIVLGTNICETSITIDDCTFVIDSGKFKENRYDARRALSQLITCWVSKAAARQRQGRAGRVKPGMCFRLFSNKRFESLQDHQVCEMHRVPLENIILQIHALNLGDEVELLSKALDPPQRKAIEASIKVLSHLGALVKSGNKAAEEEAAKEDKSKQQVLTRQKDSVNNASNAQYSLTSLGFHLTNLPIDVRIGKMIVLAAVLRCVDPVLTIAAALSGRSPFSAVPDDAPRVETLKRSFSRSHQSDFASTWFVYAGWLAARNKKNDKQFVRDSCLSVNSLIGIQSTKRQLERYLVESGFLKQKEGASPVSQPHSTLDGTVYEIGGNFYNSNATSFKCITASIVGGLHPNISKILPPKKPQPGVMPRPGGNLVGCGTADGSIASIHPSSINAKAMGEFNFPLIAYLEKIKTSTIFLRDTTVVSPYTLILFAGDSRFHPEFEELSYDGWLSFRCCASDASLLLGLRRQLDAALASKINDPSAEWESVASVAVQAMVKLIHEESLTSLQLTTERRRRADELAANQAAASHLSKPSIHSGGGGGSGGPVGGQGRNSNIGNAILDEYVDPRTGKKLSYGARMRLQSKMCFNCGEKGHVSSMCPNQSRKFPGGPVINCFICGSMKHHPIDCDLCAKRKLPEGVSATFGADS